MLAFVVLELWTEVGDQPASVSDAATSLAAGLVAISL